jgi:hypothetical protein
MNKARVRKAIFALAAFLIVIQFVQPRRTNPPIVPSRALAAHVPVPEAVQSILMRACGDCHSNRTVWPWYSHVAPLSWVIVDDVNQGRRHMNLQDSEARATRAATDRPFDLCKEVREKGMPPFTYRMMHKDARLAPQEIDALCSWSQSLGPALEQALSGHQ